MTSFNFGKLRRFGLTPLIVNRIGPPGSPPEGDSILARVTEVQRDCFFVHDGDAGHRARALPRLVLSLQASESTLTIGDWVLLQVDTAGEWWIHQRLEPVTQIARRANDGRRQPLASNVDTALLTMGLDADFNPRRMERYIAMVRACGVAPLVVLTKSDVAPDARARFAQMCRRLPARKSVV